MRSVPSPPPGVPGGAPLHDPFSWRECLTPPGGVSPAVSQRGSRAGSRVGSRAPTPGNETPPYANTPPRSPLLPPASARSLASGRSNGSARSGASGRSAGGYPVPPPPPGPPPDGLSSRSHSSQSGAFATPESSARHSEFASVYESMSASHSARTAEFDTVYERQPIGTEERKKHRVCAAALEAFATQGPGDGSGFGGQPQAQQRRPVEPPAVLPEPSVDDVTHPSRVYSAARHGKHKDVEAALKCGFDPDWTDSFGNTLFHVACQNGNKRIAKLAIKYGGDMDAQNAKGNTGLHFLFTYGYPDIGEYFIEKGASDTVLNDAGCAPQGGLKSPAGS